MSLTISRKLRDESNQNHPSSGTVRQGEGKPVEINHQDDIYAIAFLADGKQVVTGGKEQKIRCWRVEDGKEVGTPMDAGGNVWNIAVSLDGKWIVSGTESGQVTVWNAESHEKATEFKAHSNLMRAVDVSWDGTRITTGSDDKTLNVWSLSTGQRLFNPLQHTFSVAAVKFSPNRRYIAAATWFRNSVRVYHDPYGTYYLHMDFPIRVSLSDNQSLAWASDSTRLFALSFDGTIHCLDVDNRTTLSQWPIHSNSSPMCIALSSSETFIAVSAESSVSFWDTITHKQIGSVIKHTTDIESMAISTNYDIVLGGGETINLWRLCDILPLPYSDHVFPKRVMRRMNVVKAHIEDTVYLPLTDIHDIRAQNENLYKKIEKLENTVQELRSELTRISARSRSGEK